MPAPCTVCKHPDLSTIDAALLNGSSQRSVAKASGLSPSAVQRHVKSGHVSDLLSAVSKRVEAVEHDELIAEAVGLYERTLALLTEAEHAKDAGMRIKASREVRGNLELLARLAIAAPPTSEAGGERLDLDAALLARIGATQAQRSGVDMDDGPIDEDNPAREEGKAALTPLALEAGPPGGGGGSTSSP